MLASGFFLCYGPYEGKTHYARAMSRTGFLDALREIKQQTGDHWVVFGDSAFASGPHMQCMFKGACVNQDRRLYNRHMSKLRIAVEWGFGSIHNLFPYASSDLPMGSMAVDKIFHTAAFLKNCHTAAYGDLVGSYFKAFNVTTQITLEEYIRLGQD